MRKRITSLLLTLVMLLSLVPVMGVTASAAGNPDPTVVSVDGGKRFSVPNDLYYKNNDAAGNFSGSSSDYNAAYDPATGTLTLNGYNGGKIALGGAAADHLTIKLIGDNNSITVDGDEGIGANANGSSITITADSSGGKLTINVTSDSSTVAGINNNYASSATSGNVTINGYADVTITATANVKDKACYGIYANKVAIEDNAKVAITVNAPKNEGGNLVYGIFVKENATINTAGEIMVDAFNAGTGDRVYSTGVNSKGTLTLTKVGGMTVKWRDKSLGGPLYPNEEFDPNAYDNHVDTTNCVATYTPKGTTVTTYKVSFDANGGSGTMADVTGISGSYTLPANGFTAPAGQQFKGWATSASGTVITGTSITVSADTTLYAIWEPIPVTTYTVSFNANGGSGTMADVTGISGSYTLPANGFTAPAGQQFKGWATSASGTVITGTSITVTENTTLYAIWEPIPVTTYTVSFNANGGTGTMADVTGVTGSYTLPTCTFTAPSGKQFKGWATSASGAVITDASITVTADTTLYAIWEPIPVTKPAITTVALPDGKVGDAYNQTLAATGTNPIAWSIEAGDLPDGLTLVGDTIKGTPSKAGQFKFTVKAANGGGSDTKELTIKVADAEAAKYHNVTLSGAGTGATGAGSHAAGTTVNIYAGTKSGYTFNGWTSDDVTVLSASSKNASFVMPDKDVTVKANWVYNGGGSSGGYTYYTIKATAGVNGSISPTGNVSVREGRDQTFTITPNKGYAVAKVLIDSKNVGAVKSYTFENVKKNHTIEVVFMKASGNPQTGVFVDVPEGSYYEEAVNWAVDKGITTGTDATHFSPDGICTRAQAVTFLWRAAGSPAAKSAVMPFTDVKAGSYYYDAVLWAVENGITKGTSETMFSPDATCSRAQIVTFLWRSQKSPAAGTANPFTDVKASAYYADAVLWAVKEDVTKGTTNTTFSPDATCTRAQIVTFIWRALAE